MRHGTQCETATPLIHHRASVRRPVPPARKDASWASIAAALAIKPTTVPQTVVSPEGEGKGTGIRILRFAQNDRRGNAFHGAHCAPLPGISRSCRSAGNRFSQVLKLQLTQNKKPHATAIGLHMSLAFQGSPAVRARVMTLLPPQPKLRYYSLKGVFICIFFIPPFGTFVKRF